ncbi:MAG: tRNA (adenosine(37)-N6)-threonylcarbamoyltransferase complex dimerization subunit type 1 TsaB [Clostridia bacterium]|nr:tRNA (adenosine(37)-N6)-threonylcarbamoyltransferase complex dimerization subunit type 1 TsaB [Clostridia bacterium]
MITLSLDTTTQIASAAITENGKLLCEYTLNSGNTHSVTLLPMVKHMLETVKLSCRDVDLYAVSVGPGSFTGVRIGVSCAKGLAFATNTPCVPVSSLEAMAENLKGLEGIICPVINARRSQVYTALFKGEKGNITRLTEDTTLIISELEEKLKEHESVWFVGDAYDMVSYMTNNITPLNLRNVNAAGVASVGERIYREAADKAVFTDAALQPVYLKKTQAEREREERLSMEEKTNE